MVVREKFEMVVRKVVEQVVEPVGILIVQKQKKMTGFLLRRG